MNTLRIGAIATRLAAEPGECYFRPAHSGANLDLEPRVRTVALSRLLEDVALL
jgi:hypothetical protein